MANPTLPPEIAAALTRYDNAIAAFAVNGLDPEAAVLTARAALDARIGALVRAVNEAVAELENDPKTRTCHNVAAALRAALAAPTATPETSP